MEKIRVAVGGVEVQAVNAKEHDTGGLIVSMRRFGYIDPVVINGVTGRLIAGHGRIEALGWMERMGEGRPRGVDAGEDGEWVIEAVVVEIGEAEEAAAVLALNRIGEIGGWDWNTVEEILRGIVEDGGEVGLEGTGFDADDLQRIVEQNLADDGDSGAEGQELDEEIKDGVEYRIIVEDADAELIEQLTEKGYRWRRWLKRM